MDFKVARAYIHTATYCISIQREELLENEQTIFEVGVRHFEPQFDEHIVVLVVHNTESITLKHFAIRHPAIAKEDLRALRECVLASFHLKGEVLGNIFNDLVPNGLRHIFSHFNLLLTAAWSDDFAQFCILGLILFPVAHPLVAESILLYQKRKVVVTFEATRHISRIFDVPFLLLLLFFFILFCFFLRFLLSLLLHVFHCHFHEL